MQFIAAELRIFYVEATVEVGAGLSKIPLATLHSG
jgi:hypothetical protein